MTKEQLLHNVGLRGATNFTVKISKTESVLVVLSGFFPQIKRRFELKVSGQREAAVLEEMYNKFYKLSERHVPRGRSISGRGDIVNDRPWG